MLPLPSAYRARVYDALSILIFFHLTVLAWIPFRAPDLTTAFDMFVRALRFEGLQPWIDHAEMMTLIVGLFGLHILERWVTEYTPTSTRVWSMAPAAVRSTVLAGVVVLIVIGSGSRGSEVIYFRF